MSLAYFNSLLLLAKYHGSQILWFLRDMSEALKRKKFHLWDTLLQPKQGDRGNPSGSNCSACARAQEHQQGCSELTTRDWKQTGSLKWSIYKCSKSLRSRNTVGLYIETTFQTVLYEIKRMNSFQKHEHLRAMCTRKCQRIKN